MLFDEYIEHLKDDVITEYSDKVVSTLINSTIMELQQMKEGHIQFPEDCGLKNIWNEICVQVQEEKSFYWPAYELTIEQILFKRIENLPKVELMAIWMQTEGYWEWYCSFDPDESIPIEMSKMRQAIADVYEGSLSDDALDYLKDLVIERASNYTNKQIENFLFSRCVLG